MKSDHKWKNLANTTPGGGQTDADGDGLANLREYQLGTDPSVPDGLRFGPVVAVTNGVVSLTLEEVYGRSVTLKGSSNLVDWFTVTNFVGSDATINFQEPADSTAGQRFYKATVP